MQEVRMATSQPKYKVDDYVLCQYAQGSFYEAKIVDVSTEQVQNESVYKYLVHYKGWGKRFDEWLIEPLVFDVTEETMGQVQKKPQRAKKDSKRKSQGVSERKVAIAAPATPTLPSSDDGSQVSSGVSDESKQQEEQSVTAVKRKRGRPKLKVPPAPDDTPASTVKEQPVGSDDASICPPEAVEDVKEDQKPVNNVSGPQAKDVNINTAPTSEQSRRKKRDVPQLVKKEKEKPKIREPSGKVYWGRYFQLNETLASCLNEDSEQVETYKRITKMPPEMSVKQIINEYYEFRASKEVNEKRRERVKRFASSLIKSFNIHAPVCLLYEFEKLQYAEIHKVYDQADLADYYSFPHLLRYVMKIEEFMQELSMEAEYRDQAFTVLMSDFIRFLTRNVDRYFKPNTSYIDMPPSYHRMAYC